MLAFLQHFNQLQDVLGRMRAAHAGKKIAETAQRGSRIRLDIEAGAPIVLVPHSSKTTDILVINMGNLTVKNIFLETGKEGTIAYKRLQEQMERKAKRERANSEAESARSRNSTGSKDFSTMPVTNLDANVPAPDRPSNLYQPSMMNQSIYGSLEGDLRSEDLAPTLETTMSSLISKSHCTSNKPALSSFYSAVGGGSVSPTAVSSSIGAKPQFSPEHSGSVVPMGK